MTQTTEFGTTATGTTVQAITISSADLRATILTYGAVLNDVRMAGVDYPLTLGSPNIAAYEGKMGSFGSLIGPVANRINGAKANIDGITYHFERRDGGNFTLHSGKHGCQNQVWTLVDHGPDFVTLSLDMPDGQAGFPGNRTVTATYRIIGATLDMTVQATTDELTLFNFANHSYWCLDPQVGFAGYELKIDADRYTETDDSLCPTGNTPAVQNTVYDFTAAAPLAGDSSQFIDTNFCLSDQPMPLRPVAWLAGTSGLRLEMATTKTGLQVFDCGTINAPGFETHHGAAYGPYAAPALEAQSWPDAPNHRHFPSIEYGPTRPYSQTTQWRFSRG